MAIFLLPVILAFLLASTNQAHAEIISGIIGLTALIEATVGASVTIGAATITAGAIGGAIVTGAIGIGAAVLSRAFGNTATTGDGQAATQSGSSTTLRVGADVPRNRIFGRQLISGQLAYWNLYGDQNRWLQLVYVLGSGPHQLFQMYGDGKPLTLGAFSGPGQPITDYNVYGAGGAPVAWVSFHQGFEDQAVDADLVSGAQPPGRWAATNTGVGVCYARVTLFFWPESFKNGIPSFSFDIGALCYDPRKDSTSGGSGSHLWSDKHTWEWTDNPAVCLYNFHRGLYLGNQRVIGRGLAPVDMVRAMYVDSANVCDEMVATNADPIFGEKRYRVGMNVGADRDLKSVEQDLMVAMAGSLVEVGGAWGPIAGAAKEIVATITDADFVDGQPIRYSQKKPRDQLVNALYGSYSEPAQLYQAVPYAPRTSSADEAADGGERFQAQRDYVMVQSQTQAQRIGEIERRDGRFQGSATGTLPFKYSYIEAGDWIRWTSARRNFDKYFRVKTHRLAPDQTIELSFDETDPSVFDFDHAIDELDPLHPGDLPGIGDLITTVPDFAVATAELAGAGGTKVPAIYASWSPILDRTVTDVVIQYRVGTDDGTIKVSPFLPPEDGEAFITDGVNAATGYQARATIVTDPARATTWTAWLPVVSGTQVVLSALTSTPIDEVTLAMFEAGLRNYVAQQLQAAQELQSGYEQLIASLTTEQEAQNRLELHLQKDADVRQAGQISTITGGMTWRGDWSATELYHVNDMVRGPDGIMYYTTADVTGVSPPSPPWVPQFTYALISNQWRTFAGADGVAAQTSDQIEARFTGTGGDLEQSLAQVISQWKAFAGPDFATAQSEQTTLTTLNGHTTSITQNATAVANINGQLAAKWSVVTDVNGHISGIYLYNSNTAPSLFSVVADKFLVSRPNASGGSDAPVPVFLVNTGTVDGTPAQVIINGNLVADGTITAAKVTTGTLITLEAQIANAIINSAHIKALNVDNIHIRGAAITVPGGTSGAVSGIPPTLTLEVCKVDLPFRGVAGSSVPIQGQATVTASPGASATSTIAVNMEINVDGSVLQVASVAQTGPNSGFFPLVGSRTITATGGDQVCTVRILAVQFAGSGTTGAADARLFGCVYLR